MSVQSVHAFAEKVALISDGSGPIGRSIAIQLALNGCYVIVGSGDEPEETERALAELMRLGTLAKVVSTDVSKPEGAAQLVDEVKSAFGRLDLLVNCLKIHPQSSFQSSSEEDVAAVMANNFCSAYYLTRHAVPLMQDRPKPRIVNLISRDISPNPPLFEAAQWAIEGFTRSLARSLPHNFRVNAVAATRRSVNEPDPMFPMGADASAQDIARAVLYLLSPEAASVNGNVLEVGL